jgi:hypothetical protein
VSDSRREVKTTASSGGCDVDIKIDNQGDINIYNCTEGRDDRKPPHECPECEECKPERAEGACVPLGLGCKPKQSKRQKLEQLKARNKVPSALAASFFQTARRFLRGNAPANDFESDVFPLFEAMPRAVRDIMECAVDSYESTPSDLKNAGLEPSLLADADKPIDTKSLTVALLREIKERASEVVFGNPHASEAERPGLNRFFDPGGEIFFAQLQICRVNDIRTATFRPQLSIGDYLPSEIQQHCELVLVGEEIKQNCKVQTENCPGNVLPDNVCARVPDVTSGDAVVLTGVNFMSTDIKVRLTARVGSASAEVDAHVFGDLDTPLNEEVGGVTRIIQDCRVTDRLTFIVPEELPPGVYELQLVMENTTGIEVLGPTILSNTEYINVLPPSTARFQIVAEHLRARVETAPASFGSDEVALTILAAELLSDGSTSSIQRLKSRFEDVDSGESRNIESVVFSQSQEMVGVALTVVGHEVDSERAFNQQIESFEEAFLDYLTRAWDKFKAELGAGAAAVIKKLGLLKGAIAIAIAAVVAIAIVAVVAYWAPADLIVDDAIGYSVIELAELTNANAPSPTFEQLESPQGLKVSLNPLEKGALTYREFREYFSQEEESRYEIFLRYNRIA